jgi:uncharacterized Rmd1/YagE family protein
MSFEGHSSSSSVDLLGLNLDKPEEVRESVVDRVDSFFEQNVDFDGKPLPYNMSYQALAKGISPVGECFFFDYGVVVIWGLTEQEEKTVLRNLRNFEEEKLPFDQVEIEEFHFHYNVSQQPRIYNDVITLKVNNNCICC